jgi:hypothetical protein
MLFYIEDYGFFFSDGEHAGLAMSNKLAVANGQNDGGICSMRRSIPKAGNAILHLGLKYLSNFKSL